MASTPPGNENSGGPVSSPFIFAQLCKELTTVEVSTAHIFDLYRDASHNPFTIDVSGFITTFYGHQGNFQLDCDASGHPHVWEWLHNWFYSPEGNIMLADLMDASFNLVGTVEGIWGEDLNSPPSCWTVCSHLRITEELLKANHICTLKCNVCCSLCAFELAEALNSIGNSDLDNRYSSSMSPYEPRTATRPVMCGDRLVLSILFTNANTGVNPVDLHLHFQVTDQFYTDSNGIWNGVCADDPAIVALRGPGCGPGTAGYVDVSGNSPCTIWQT